MSNEYPPMPDLPPGVMPDDAAPGAGKKPKAADKPPESSGAASVLDALEGLPDDELRAVAEKARAMLAERGKARRAEALREIQALAKKHGLAVDVKDPTRKRGRPRKPKEGAGA